MCIHFLAPPVYVYVCVCVCVCVCVYIYIYIQTPGIASLSLRCDSWRSPEDGGKSKYCIIGNFCSKTLLDAK